MPNLVSGFRFVVRGKNKKLVNSGLQVKRTSDQKGFTLVEILVTVSIIAVIIYLSAANLRNFSKSQEINEVSSRILQVLRVAQSSGSSATKCSNTPSMGFKAEFFSDRYKTYATCFPVSPTPTASPGTEGLENVINPKANYSSNVTMFQSTCGASSISLWVEFNKSGFTLGCSSGNPPVGNQFCLQLRNSKTSENTFIKINSGGVIYEDKSVSSC